MARYALFIGISDYADRYISNLRLAHRDAQNLHGLFRHRLGFGDNAILLPPNAGLREFNRQFNQIGEKIQAGDSFILYFAGHGHQHGDNQYLLLPDANRHVIEAGEVAGEELLSLNTLMARIGRWPESDCLFILDACRSPIAAESRRGDTERYRGTAVLQRMFTRDLRRGSNRPGNQQAEKGALAVVLNACSENDVAYEPAEGEAGVLCQALEDEIVARLERGAPVLLDATTPARLIAHIRLRWSDCPQTPWLSPATSQFVLHAQREETPAPATVKQEGSAPGGSAYLDERMWRLARLDDTEESYRRYIQEAGPEAGHIEEAFTCLARFQKAKRHSDAAALKVMAEMQQREKEAEIGRQAEEAERLRKVGEAKARQEAGAKQRAQEAAELEYLRPGRVFREADWTPEMVVIPAGEFLMGSPEDEPERDSWEGPQHLVKIARPFALGKYPVTQREWRAVMEGNPSHFKGDDLPVEQVSWEDAQAYIEKLNQRLGLSPVAGYRLPSEAEWEYACRAGTSTPFSTGQTMRRDMANFSGWVVVEGGEKLNGWLTRGLIMGKPRDLCKTVPIGSFTANAWGLYDMHGNVWEWVEDCWHSNYEGSPKDGGAWVTSCEESWRVLRGGSWASLSRSLRSANRFISSPGYRGLEIGFRLARTL